MCFRTFHFDLENSLLDDGTSDLVCEQYDVCPLRLVIFYNPGMDQNFVVLDFVYHGCLKKVKRYIVPRWKETCISYARINHLC